jgi:hypothetical protein
MRYAFLIFILAGASFADTLTLDTSALETSGTGPFVIDFQFDSADQAVSNTVTLSDFLLGGGSLNESPVSETGGITVGASPFSVALTNSSFFNDVQFAFTPGSSLSFDVASTSNAEPDTPDTFTFAIFDGSGNEIPTTNPNFFDSFLEIDLPGGGSPLTTILSASLGYVDAAGNPVNIAAPTFESGSPGGGSAVPEPSALPLAGLAGGVMIGLSKFAGVGRRKGDRESASGQLRS